MNKILPSENILVDQLCNGNQVAFTELYNYYFSSVNAFVFRFVKLNHLSEDITQEVFIKIWEGRAQLGEVKSFRAWLFTIARNHTLNVLKRISNESVAIGEILKNYHCHQDHIDDKILEKDYLQHLNNALNSLPPQTRRVFHLCREHDKSYDEVAAILGISRDAVKKHMVRSHKTLKSDLNKKFNFSISLLLIFIFRL